MSSMTKHEIVMDFISYCHRDEHENMLVEELAAEFLHQSVYVGKITQKELVAQYEAEMGY